MIEQVNEVNRKELENILNSMIIENIKYLCGADIVELRGENIALNAYM